MVVGTDTCFSSSPAAIGTATEDQTEADGLREHAVGPGSLAALLRNLAAAREQQARLGGRLSDLQRRRDETTRLSGIAAADEGILEDGSDPVLHRLHAAKGILDNGLCHLEECRAKRSSFGDALASELQHVSARLRNCRAGAAAAALAGVGNLTSRSALSGAPSSPQAHGLASPQHQHLHHQEQQQEQQYCQQNQLALQVEHPQKLGTGSASAPGPGTMVRRPDSGRTSGRAGVPLARRSSDRLPPRLRNRSPPHLSGSAFSSPVATAPTSAVSSPAAGGGRASSLSAASDTALD
eukprot:TRINITY_DN38334_c0_g1_i1.p1 TRINITY_DN38334_c0_g1~~TRINITY_DN38334_c0_g1_i1.p1  ORF type:complete len:295 (-),score=51.38 TRINITY_DN38334_c0_g1_i1:111-995(-)